MNQDQILPELTAIAGGAPPEPPEPPEPAAPDAVTTPLPPAAGAGKKAILLVDSNLRSRESRAKIMRGMGASVDCVADAAGARARLETEKYNLILMDLGRDVGTAESLAQEIKTRNSRQLVGFLVGSPLFVSTKLNGRSQRGTRVPAYPTTAVSVLRPQETNGGMSDFGQKIKDAEAEDKNRESR